MKVGVISDNHSVIHPKVYTVFEDVELIIHAGDMGSEDVITSLETLAPVKAVHGNIDSYPLRSKYPEVLALEIHSVAICIIHEFITLQSPTIVEAMKNLSKPKLDIVIYGHSHQAKLHKIDDVLLFNPGSAGKRRFTLRPTVGLLQISKAGQFTSELIFLDEV